MSKDRENYRFRFGIDALYLVLLEIFLARCLERVWAHRPPAPTLEAPIEPAA